MLQRIYYAWTRFATLFTTPTMSSPAARAEARRKAILGRGGDRLAKLTTSARGEEGPAYLRGGEFIDEFCVYHSRRRRRCTRQRDRCIRRGRDKHAPSTAPAKRHTETVAIATCRRSLGLVRGTTAPIHAGPHGRCTQPFPTPDNPTPTVCDSARRRRPIRNRDGPDGEDEPAPGRGCGRKGPRAACSTQTTDAVAEMDAVAASRVHVVLVGIFRAVEGATGVC